MKRVNRDGVEVWWILQRLRWLIGILKTIRLHSDSCFSDSYGNDTGDTVSWFGVKSAPQLSPLLNMREPFSRRGVATLCFERFQTGKLVEINEKQDLVE